MWLLWPSTPHAGQDPLREAVLTGSPDVVHHLVATVLDDGLADPAADVLEGLVPADLLELSGAPLPHAAHRVQDPFGVVGSG